VPVEEVQQLIDLLDGAPMVTELSLQGASGSRITIKKCPAAVHNVPASVAADQRQVEESAGQSFAEKAVAPVQAINATLVGLFHVATPPLEPGSPVVAGQIVGYIESMRLMNDVVSNFEGTVETASASDGQPVEYGQQLFTIVAR
jgi:biotin carboxyl carrier protein